MELINNDQLKKLKKQPHIVVGTPGRIKDLVEEQALFVHKANTIIVDEADLMLDMGFIHDVDKIAARMPKTCKCWFSLQQFLKN